MQQFQQQQQYEHDSSQQRNIPTVVGSKSWHSQLILNKSFDLFSFAFKFCVQFWKCDALVHTAHCTHSIYTLVQSWDCRLATMHDVYDVASLWTFRCLIHIVKYCHFDWRVIKTALSLIYSNASFTIRAFLWPSSVPPAPPPPLKTKHFNSLTFIGFAFGLWMSVRQRIWFNVYYSENIQIAFRIDFLSNTFTQYPYGYAPFPPTWALIQSLSLSSFIK